MANSGNFNNTITAIATPPGTGAIAVIRISGRNALQIGDEVFYKRGTKISTTPSHQALFGTIQKDGKIIDEVIAVVYRGPKSFTGEDTVEFSCHGSTFIQKEILNL